MARRFTPGLELSRRFYEEAVVPIVERVIPGVAHSAARMGNGSEVLGFDTERSADHEWGPRLQLFLKAKDWKQHHSQIDAALSAQLPKAFMGYPTHFVSPDGGPIGHMTETEGPVTHRIAVTTTEQWFKTELGFHPLNGATFADWLATPTQLLAVHSGGEVFHDGLNELVAARRLIAWYPTDVWRYVLACQWQRVSQEEAFVGRTGEVGDDLGSSIVTARLARDLMRLAFLLERQWAPYSKWLGTSFSRLDIASELQPALNDALGAHGWQQREQALGSAYETVARAQNSLGLCDEVDPTLRSYHGRPFLVIHAERFAGALKERIEDPAIKALSMAGAIDQIVDNSDVLSDPGSARAMSANLVSARGSLDIG